MPEIPPSLSAFSGVRQLDTDARVKLGDDGKVQQSGTQKWDVFARARDWLTRSPAQVESNKAVARELVQGIREAYGDKVAGMVSRELKSHLSSGRPLTAYRVERTLEKAQELSGRIAAANDLVLRGQAPRILEGALREAFGIGTIPDNGVLDREAYLEAVDRAITQDPEFSRTDFTGDDERFVRHFTGVARNALERATMAVLTPNSMAIIERDGAPDTKLQEELQMFQLTRLGLPPGQAMAFSRAAVSLEALTETLTTPVEVPISPQAVTTHLGQIKLLQGQLSPPRPGFEEHLTELKGLPPKALEYRDALLEDMKGLMARIGERIGWNSLAPGAQETLMQCFTIVGELQEDMNEGRIGRVAGLGAGQREILQAGLEALEGMQPDDPRARVLVEAQKDQVNETLARLAQFDEQNGLNALDGGQRHSVVESLRIGATLRQSIESGDWQGIAGRVGELRGELEEHLQSLQDMRPQDPKAMELVQLAREQAGRMIDTLRGFEEEVRLAREQGFDAPDVAWLRDNERDVRATLERFTPEEAGLLAGAGFGIAVGLEYKDKGVPIHPRTLPRDYTDDNLVGQPRRLGGGALSAPFEVSYRDTRGEVQRSVYKEAIPGQGYGPGSRELGIDPDDSRMTVRNVATRVVDELLGFGLVPDTQFGMLEGRLGMVMGFAPGASPITRVDVDISGEDTGRLLLEYHAMVANGEMSGEDLQAMLQGLECRIEDGKVIRSESYAVENFDFSEPRLRRELVKLQLLDALTAQSDRHGGNYIIALDGNGRFQRLLAIDNDQAFGTRVGDPNELLRAGIGGGKVTLGDKAYGNVDFNGVLLPEVVDAEIKQYFDRLQPDDLRQALAGLLPEAEIELALTRLGAIKEHLNGLQARGRVIEPGQWGGEVATQALQDPNTSYVARDGGLTVSYPVMQYDDARH